MKTRQTKALAMLLLFLAVISSVIQANFADLREIVEAETAEQEVLEAIIGEGRIRREVGMAIMEIAAQEAAKKADEVASKAAKKAFKIGRVEMEAAVKAAAANAAVTEVTVANIVAKKAFKKGIAAQEEVPDFYELIDKFKSELMFVAR